MNTDPKAITVLCYGDSNTNGKKPDRNGRYAANERWTGVLQNLIGDGYYIIEEGLGGRTTDLEHYNPNKPNRNGIEYFRPCLDSHMPLDVIIIMLGTNDAKTVYKRSAEDVAKALKQFPNYVDEYCRQSGDKRPKIILVSPPYMDEKALRFFELMPKPGVYDEISAQKTREFADPIKTVAEEIGCEFFDAATIAKTGEDGCHLDPESHKKLANSFAKIIRET